MNGLINEGHQTNESVGDLIERRDIKWRPQSLFPELAEVAKPKTPAARKHPRISGIWSNAYVRRLGINDHCEELLCLYEELRKAKISSDQEWLKSVSECIDRETMDLLLILESWADGKTKLRDARFKKFEEKAAEDAKCES